MWPAAAQSKSQGQGQGRMAPRLDARPSPLPAPPPPDRDVAAPAAAGGRRGQTVSPPGGTNAGAGGIHQRLPGAAAPAAAAARDRGACPPAPTQPHPPTALFPSPLRAWRFLQQTARRAAVFDAPQRRAACQPQPHWAGLGRERGTPVFRVRWRVAFSLFLSMYRAGRAPCITRDRGEEAPASKRCGHMRASRSSQKWPLG